MSNGEWITWKGGECPVPEKTLVFIKCRDGSVTKLPREAHLLRWTHFIDNEADIVAYRIRIFRKVEKIKQEIRPRKIAIAAAKKFAQEHGLRQVIIIGLQDNDQHIVTYGTTKEDCRQAGIGGDNLKKLWGWPKATLSKYSSDTVNDDA